MVESNICNNNCCTCKEDPCIEKIPLLSNLNKEELSQVSEGIITKEYKKGEYIFRTGDESDKLYIVCSGRMKIYKYLSDGREQILYIYGSRDFVGAFNLLKKDKYKYNGVALEDTTISTLSKESFDRIVIKNPNITLKILEKAYERIRWAEGLINVLSSGNANAKVASLLLNLIEDFGTETKEGIKLNLSINREEMGSYAGITRETMTRKLREFKELGYIDFEGNRKIILLQQDKLKEML
ncbi:MAG TPA: Crp/Fnr family transcriptional regulator [Tissierellaceae bacterium]|nr:Crp/Fnr family transcriptional regulator [Tissierellaceae bacterium]